MKVGDMPRIIIMTFWVNLINRCSIFRFKAHKLAYTTMIYDRNNPFSIIIMIHSKKLMHLLKFLDLETFDLCLSNPEM